ncbi:polysaccharide deacetylase family protein [Herbidospora sp. RD11066]
MRRLIPALAAVAMVMTLPAAPAVAAPKKAPKKPFCATHKCIALTFDDGPGPYTTKLLATLKKYNAKATFFVIGREVNKHQTLLKTVAKAGHQIGNHTWTHPWLTELTRTEVYDEVNETQKLIKKVTGKNPSVMRAPGGLTDDTVREIAAKLNMVLIPGTTSTGDWIADNRQVGYLTSKTLEVAKRGAVILMHETVKETVDSMPRVLATLKKQGYYFVTASTLLEGTKLTPGMSYPAPPPAPEGSDDDGQLLEDEEDPFGGEPAGEV